jgi:hypothetical protein
MDIKSLLRKAFFSDDAKRATSAIEQARAQVRESAPVDAFCLEVVVPRRPDEMWLRERALRPLVHLCTLIGSPPPDCAGAFIAFFHHDRVYCVLGAEVLAWASARLEIDPQALTTSR